MYRLFSQSSHDPGKRAAKSSRVRSICGERALHFLSLLEYHNVESFKYFIWTLW